MAVSSSTAVHINLLYENETKEDEKALDMEPVVNSRPRIVSLNDDILLKVGRCSILSKITVSRTVW